jgi:hypothetical protein
MKNELLKKENMIINKRTLLISLVAGLCVMATCNKGTFLPAYTPPLASNFQAKTLNHTKDTVNVGDTVNLVATGFMSDTTQFIAVSMTASYTAGGVAQVINYGSPTTQASAPVKLTRTITGAQANNLWPWSANIIFPTASNVPHKTQVTIVANFFYQLNLSSQPGTGLTLTDAGKVKKTVYVQ